MNRVSRGSSKLTRPLDVLSLWRNRLARSAVNRKVGGSSPPRGANYLLNSCSGILCVIYLSILALLIHKWFLSVVVITCPSHGQGRQFDPGRNQA